jgi:hypothetical protein
LLLLRRRLFGLMADTYSLSSDLVTWRQALESSSVALAAPLHFFADRGLWGWYSVWTPCVTDRLSG